MSDLTRFRDHCRRMATAKHRPDCKSIDPYRRYMKPNPAICGGGCITLKDRLLWSRLADEADRFITNPPDLGSTG